MSHLPQKETQSDGNGTSLQNTTAHRRRPLNVLFIHHDADAIDNCVKELERGQFTVRSDIVVNMSQCSEELLAQSYDVIIVEYPSPGCEGSRGMQLLRQIAQDIPLIFLTSLTGNESIETLNVAGAFECLGQDHITQLPQVVRRILTERQLRADLQEVEKALGHSQSLYRALADNPAYGICRCDAEGKFLAANRAFLTMLGYDHIEELLAANRASEIVLDVGYATQFAGTGLEPVRPQPIEVEWKRKDGTILQARLSGRDAFDANGHFNGCEIIAVDITEQHALEEKLRKQAGSDSLTGLANHRRLFEALHAEIARSKRTGREFSILLLDLDKLKNINDEFGHLAGDQALCRLARIMKDCCRSMDTAARHGGDEFAVVLPETNKAAAALVGQRICDLLAKDIEGPLISVSVGIASYPSDSDSIGILLQSADRQLYVMKSTGILSAEYLGAVATGLTEVRPNQSIPDSSAKRTHA
jgi:diguanylate cyclase (GGDEF)-like protein/PAS domain S-box-containing protein